MADRVAVFNKGKIEQLAAPRELYTRPATSFVARFVGGANVANAELATALAGRQAQPFAIRAENIGVLSETAAASATGNSAAGVVVAVQYHGAASRWQVQLDAVVRAGPGEQVHDPQRFAVIVPGDQRDPVATVQ